MSALRTISLYTGAGGLDLGFEAAGFKNTVAVEMHPAAICTLNHDDNRHRWGEILEGDIHSYLDEERKGGGQSAKRILDAAGLKVGEADVLIGGPPCQPFSKSGYWSSGDSKRLNDPRARTLDAYITVLETALPKVFLLENVPGMAFTDKSEGLDFLRDRISQIRKARYTFHAAQLNAAEYGVPQARSRVFIIGTREDISADFTFPEPTHVLPDAVNMSAKAWSSATFPDSNLIPALSSWDAIQHLDAVGNFDSSLALKGKWRSVLPTIPEGFNYLWHTPRGGGIPIWGWRTRYWSMLLKTAKDRPAWTLTAQPGPAIGPFHWDNRRFTTDELKALQTFPRDYKVTGSTLEAHFQIGNSVPSAIAEILARQIRIQLLGNPRFSPVAKLLPKRCTCPPPVSNHKDPRTLPLEIRQLADSQKPEHPGTGLGPGAQARVRQ